MSTKFDSLESIYDRVGHEAVLLPIPFGEKRPIFKNWEQTTYDDTQTEAYKAALAQAWRAGGNIGVLLGKASGGLIALDFDDDELVEPYLKLNPRLRETLSTRGARGCQFWLRMLGDDYPQRLQIVKLNGKKYCEFRSGGAIKGEEAPEKERGKPYGFQSVIYGRHPSGCDYQILVDRQVI